MRSPIATSRICRRAAISVAVGIEVFSFGILQGPIWPLPGWRRDRGCAPLVPVKDNLIYFGRRGSTRALARLFTVTACYQCFPMVGLKFLVTSFECFGGCRFTSAAIAVRTLDEDFIG